MLPGIWTAASGMRASMADMGRTSGSGISARVAGIAESATLAVDAKAKALKAAGEPVIGFGAGEPDFATPAAIVEAAAAATRDPKNHRYTPVPGLPDLREAIAAKTKRDTGFEVTAAQVLVTNGGKQAVAQAFACILDPDDECILPTPYWTTYPEAIALTGATPVFLTTDETTGFKVTVDQLEDGRTERTKAVVFVSPSNPTGAVYSRDEIEAIGRWAAEHDIWVITDEIYEHLTYGTAEMHSIVRVVPALAERCLVLNGVAKTYAMTGWRVGWMIGPLDVIKAATNLQSHTTSNVCNVAQRAALEALTGDLSAVAEMRAAFDRRRLTIHKMLNEIPGVTCLEPEGAFYAFPNLVQLLSPQSPTTAALAEQVLDSVNVAFIPGEAFGAPGYARFSYALADADLEEGIGRLQTLFS
jgi:aspartate/methionine/tyrosine aminotransferase